MSASHPIRILLVDDDRIHRFTTQRLLKSCGFEVEIVEQPDGKEAMDYLQAHQHEEGLWPNIIFLDLNMPVMNGWQFLDAFTKIKARVKKSLLICIVSSSADSLDIVKVSEYKNLVSAYLIKPVAQLKYNQILAQVVI